MSLSESVRRIGVEPANVTPVEARAIAKDAYIFSYPLVLHYRTMYLQAVDSAAKEYVGGFGRHRHYGMSTPDNKDIVTPNNNRPRCCIAWSSSTIRISMCCVQGKVDRCPTTCSRSSLPI